MREGERKKKKREKEIRQRQVFLYQKYKFLGKRLSIFIYSSSYFEFEVSFLISNIQQNLISLYLQGAYDNVWWPAVIHKVSFTVYFNSASFHPFKSILFQLTIVDFTSINFNLQVYEKFFFFEFHIVAQVLQRNTLNEYLVRIHAV